MSSFLLSGIQGDSFKSFQVFLKYTGIKGIRMLVSYLAMEVAANYMSQIYVEKVFVNSENPQPLIYFMLIWSIIDVVTNIVLLLTLYILKSYGIVSQDLITMYTIDVFAVMLIYLLIAWIIANVMYKKKYFAYRDDGLRGIRAYKEIMFYIFLVLGSLPIGYLIASAGMVLQAK